MSYISQLEHELVRAGRAHHQQRMRLPRPNPSGVFLGVAGVGALVLAVLALALLRHGPTSPPAASSVVPADARGLVSQLAILRRPQTAADRALGSPARGGALELGLTRLAVDTQGLKVWVVVRRVGTAGPHVQWPARDGAQAGIVAEVDGQRYRTLPVPALALRDPSMSTNAGGWFVELVPDGVSRVRWSVPVKTGTYTIEGNVIGNVAYAHIGAARAPMRRLAAWFDGKGRAVSTTPVR